MKQYLNLLYAVKMLGIKKSDRTGTGTVSLFGAQLRFNLAEGFPLLTTKKVHLKSVIHELLWFLQGDTNIKYLNDNGVTIWNEWANKDGDLGPIYGAQWRSWYYEGYVIDQIINVISEIQTNPDSRRLVVSAWNVGELSAMRLAPCHCLFQFYTHEMTLAERLQYEAAQFGTGDWSKEGYKQRGWKGYNTPEEDYHIYLDTLGVPRKKLSCQLYQRSADIFLGVPFNIASYALLTMMIAQVCDLAYGDFVHTFGDVHLYLNHIEQADIQLSRTPRELPRMIIDPSIINIDGFKYEHFTLQDYNPYPAIKAEVAI